MKQVFKSVQRLALMPLMLSLLIGFVSLAKAQNSNDSSVAAYDKLFATLKPGQEFVYIDDMGFKVETLKAWRNHLAQKRTGITTNGAFDFSTNSKWPNSRVPYIFDGNVSQAYRTMFLQGIFEWQKVANIRWETNTGSDTNYVRVFFNGSNGMNSAVGRVGNGEQILNIDTSASIYRCAHEVGHCMGFVHEQVRSDRDTYVTVTSTSPGVNALTTINWAKLPSNVNTLRGTYDFDSVMHYPASACSGTPQACASITPKEPFYSNAGSPRLGQETHISTLDGAALAIEYGAPRTISGRVTSGIGGNAVGVSGVTITCTGNGVTEYFGPPVTTDSNGDYTLLGTSTGSFTVTPSGGTFTQISRTVSTSTGSATGINFILTDSTRPTTTITTPINNQPYQALATASGTATDNIGVDYVRVAIKNNTDGKWWVWNTSSWGSTTFSYSTHVKNVDNASNSASFNWSTSLPNFGNGSYNLQANAVDVSDSDGAAFVTANYTIDNSGPDLVVTSPVHQSFVKSFSAISGTVNDPNVNITSQVKFTLYQNGDFWTGTAWKPNTTAQDPAVLLSAAVQANNTWSYSSVPTGSNQRAGTYYISAYVIDKVGNTSPSQAGINQTNFTVDGTPPTVAITSPITGSTVNALSQITGTADDDKSVGSVRVYLIRANGPGNQDDEYWDGTAWAGGGSAILPASYNSTSKIWQTSGSLPGTNNTDAAHSFTNGDYIILAISVDKAGNLSPQAQVDFSYQAVFTWTGATLRDSDPNNNSTSWGTAANWSPIGVPGASDEAVIDTGDTVTSSVNRTVAKLTFKAGTITFSNASLNAGGSWQGGGFNLQWNVPSGTSLTVSGTDRKDIGDGSAINNSGTIQWQGGGSIYNYGGSGNGKATINNLTGGVFDIAADGQIFSWTYSGSVFNNNAGAKIKKSAGSGAAIFAPFELISSGLVEANAGTLEFANTSTFNANPQFSGAGAVRFNGDIYWKSAVTALCNVRLESGALTGVVTNGTALSSYGGSGVFDWIDGALVGTHNFNVGSMVHLSTPTRKDIADGGVINNSGTIQWQGGGSIYNSGGSGNGKATINNLSGSSFDIAADGTPFNVTYGGSLFDNKSGALLVKSSGTGTALMDNFVFANAGEIRATAGKFDFDGEVRLNNGGKLTGAGSHLKSAGTAIVSGTTTVTGTSLTFSSGTLSSTGTIATNSGGALNWTGGAMDGTLNIAANSIFNILGSARKDVDDGAVINNFGTATWSEGNIYNSGGSGNGKGTINNKSGGTFNATSNGVFTVTYGGSQFNNESGATFIKSGAGTTSQFDWAFSNAGIARSDSGTLTFNAGGNSGGTFTASNNAFIRFTGGTHTLMAGVIANGAGKVQVDGGTVTATGALTSGSGNLATLEIISGTLNGTPTFTGNGTVNWKGGTIGGTFTLDTNAKMDILGPDRKDIADGGIINNKGVATWSGPGQIYSYGGSGNGNATINNLSGGTFAFAADGTPIIHTYGGSVFNNQAGGILKKTSGSGATVLTNFVFNSSGTILPQSGILEFAGAFNINADPKVAGSGVLRLTGSTLLSSALTSSSNVRLEAGSLTGAVLQGGATPATYGGSGVFDWKDGSIGGTLKLLTGATMKLSGTTRKDINDGGVINNSGTVQWQGGSIYNSGGSGNGKATINNLSGGKFEVGGDGQVFNVTYGGSVFNNQSGAAFLKTAGSGTAEVGPWLFNNSDAIVASSGLLNFGSDLNLKNGATISGLAKTRVTGGTATLTGTTSVNGTVFEFAGGTLFGSGSGATLSGGRFDFSGGALSGTINFATGSSVYLNGTEAKTISDGAILNNSGTITWQSGDIYNYGGSGNGKGTINNLSGATFNALGGGNVTLTYPGSTFNNAGLLNLSHTGGALNMGWDFVQTSTGQLKTTLNSATVYGQMKASKSVALNGALNVQTAANYAPAADATFNILDPPSTITGTFAGLSEGATLAAGGKVFQITYKGGDGDAVVLTNQVPSLSINDVSVLEEPAQGAPAGVGSVNFTVTLSAALTQNVTVKYATANGSATTPGDYTAKTGTLTIPAGQTRGIITIPIVGDTLDELNEAFFVNLSAPTGAEISDTQGRCIIIDNDAAPSAAIDDVTITEGDVDKNATFTIKLSAASGQTVTVNAIPSNGSARSPFDYTSGGVRLVFNPGETVKTFNVPVKGDLLDEPQEIFYVILSSPVNTSISRGRGVCTINDNDAAPTISIDDVRIGEGNAGQRTAAFRLKLSKPSGQVVRVNYATSGGTATAGNDYVAVPSTQIAFTTGNLYAYARVLINGDVLNEPDETFNVNLTAPINATILDNQALGTILNDDSAPSLTINDAQIVEGNSATKNLNFTVTLSKASGQTVTVKYATADGVARSTSDYTAKTGTLTFAVGAALTQTISVPISGDTTVEGNETFFVLLSASTNASIGRARGVGTIINDDSSG